MKIYVNGDSFTDGDGLADPETFPGLYPGHHTTGLPLDKVWSKKRHDMMSADLNLWNASKQNNRKYVWSTVLGNLVNAEVINNAVGGSCIMGIATRTIADLEVIQSRADLPDYVFIGLTMVDRLGWHYPDAITNINDISRWIRSSIPAFHIQMHDPKYKKLFETTWATLDDDEFLINYLKECLQIKNYVKRRIGRDPIFLNTSYAFWKCKQTVEDSKNQWLKMLWFDLLEFDKINGRWFNYGQFDTMTACGHVTPEIHAQFARDLAREHFNWGEIPVDKKA